MITSADPSICIPRLGGTVKRELLHEVFSSYNWGVIERIDLVQTGATQKAFVHFKYWYSLPGVVMVRKRLLAGASLNVIYRKPWFWKLSASKVAKPEGRF